MKRHMRLHDFTMGKAVLLAGLMVFAGLCEADAEPRERAAWTQDFSAAMFSVRHGPMSLTASFFGDGTLRVEGPLGRFDGRWSAFGDEICLDFDYGPRSGFDCESVHVIGQGSFRTETGVTLERIASVRPL